MIQVSFSFASKIVARDLRGDELEKSEELLAIIN
jgi:hypothetical protein